MNSTRDRSRHPLRRTPSHRTRTPDDQTRRRAIEAGIWNWGRARERADEHWTHAVEKANRDRHRDGGWERSEQDWTQAIKKATQHWWRDYERAEQDWTQAVEKAVEPQRVLHLVT